MFVTRGLPHTGHLSIFSLLPRSGAGPGSDPALTPFFIVA